MSEPPKLELVDGDGADAELASLFAAARALDVPPGPSPEAMAREAVIAARGRELQRARRGRIVAVGLAALAAAAALVLWSRSEPLTESPSASLAEPSFIELAPGDRLAVAAGADVSVTSLAGDDRRVDLRSGTILAEVAHLADGERFTVVTPYGEVRVRGTVFSVRVENARVDAWVHEGRVEVVRGDETRMLEAGEATVEDASPLAELGERWAEARGRVSEVATPTPSPREDTEPSVAAPEPSEATSEEPTTADRRRGRASHAEQASEDPQSSLSRPPTAEPPTTAEGWMERGDALRRERRHADAATAYERAAALLPPSRAAVAGYLGASQHAAVGAWNDALRVLDATHASDPDAMLESQALALRVRALLALGRRQEARVAAQRYLARFPDGPERAQVERALAD
ncbi:MAG: FecR domain-containing protein [Sandaracinaceae bacterium]